MANNQQIRQQLCTIIATESIKNWDFTNPDHEALAGKEGMLESLWLLNTATSENQEIDEALKVTHARFINYRNTLRQVLVTLKKANIPVICMRGLALEASYGEKIIARPQSDIDLLFNPSDSLMAKQTLGALGFLPTKSYPNIFKRGTIYLDTHTEPLGINRIQAWHHLTPLRAPDFFNYAKEGQLMGENALLIEPRVMLPYLCFHALKHSFERLIWLYDIALMCKRIEQDGQWGVVLAGIREYKLERPCFYALSYAKEHLGAPVSEDFITQIKPNMGWLERRLYHRHMQHKVIPFLAERIFSRMQPSFSHRIEFWRETIYPRLEIREQMANGGCVKCSFIRTRLKQIARAIWAYTKETLSFVRS